MQILQLVTSCVPTRVTSRTLKQQVAPPSQTDELTAKQVEYIFAAMKSDSVIALRELLANRAER